MNPVGYAGDGSGRRTVISYEGNYEDYLRRKEGIAAGSAFEEAMQGFRRSRLRGCAGCVI